LWKEEEIEDNGNIELEPIIKFQAHNKYITNVAFRDGGKTLMTSSADGTLKLWSIDKKRDSEKRGEEEEKAKNEKEEKNNQKKNTENDNKNNGIENMATQVRSYQGHEGWVWDFKFSADGAYMVSVGSDSIARLWDVENGEIISIYVGHQKALTSVALNDLTFNNENNK